MNEILNWIQEYRTKITQPIAIRRVTMTTATRDRRAPEFLSKKVSSKVLLPIAAYVIGMLLYYFMHVWVYDRKDPQALIIFFWTIEDVPFMLLLSEKKVNNIDRLYRSYVVGMVCQTLCVHWLCAGLDIEPARIISLMSYVFLGVSFIALLISTVWYHYCIGFEKLNKCEYKGITIYLL